MPITQTPILLKDVSLTLIKTGTTGTAEEYSCQLSQAQLTPSAGGGGGGGATLETFCDTYSSQGAGANATWTLDLGGFQQYQDVADLSMLLFNNEGSKYTFVLNPDIGVKDPASASGYSFTGEITATPVQIGGTANQYATFTTSQPLVSKPVASVVTPAGGATGTVEF